MRSFDVLAGQFSTSGRLHVLAQVARHVQDRVLHMPVATPWLVGTRACLRRYWRHRAEIRADA